MFDVQKKYVNMPKRLDELQRAAFMARNTGRSVRIVLPFNKMAQVNKAVAFSFAEYLRIRIADASEFDGQDEVCMHGDVKRPSY